MSRLVELEPTEYDKKGKRIRVWQYEFCRKLRVGKLKRICEEKMMEKEPKIYENPDGIVYHYPDKPKLIIKEGKIYTTKEELRKYSTRECKHQASILLRLLYYPKRHRRIIKAKRTTATFARLNFLKNATNVNETKTIDGLSVTLLRAGEYRPDNYYRLGFDLNITNNSNKKQHLELRPTILGNTHRREFPMKMINLEPKEAKDLYFYSPRLKERTIDFRIRVDYLLKNRKGKIEFLVK